MLTNDIDVSEANNIIRNLENITNLRNSLTNLIKQIVSANEIQNISLNNELKEQTINLISYEHDRISMLSEMEDRKK